MFQKIFILAVFLIVLNSGEVRSLRRSSQSAASTSAGLRVSIPEPQTDEVSLEEQVQRQKAKEANKRREQRGLSLVQQREQKYGQRGKSLKERQTTQDPVKKKQRDDSENYMNQRKFDLYGDLSKRTDLVEPKEPKP